MRKLMNEFGWMGPDKETLKQRYSHAHSEFVECMGLKVHVCIEGSGPDLVLIHGFGASLHTWDDVTAILKRQFRVIRFDLPPFGLTGPLLDQHGEPRTLDVHFYQSFIDQMLEQLEVEKAVLVGNSFGGFLSWDYSVRHPEKIRGLVLCDAAGYPSRMPIHVKLLTYRPLAWLVRFALPAFMIRRAAKDVYGDPRRLKKETLRRYVALFIHQTNRMAIGKMINVFQRDAMRHERIKQIACKTLIIWGGSDTWISVEYASKFHNDIADSELKVYRQTGHTPMEEMPERFANDCIEFIESL